MDQLLLEFWANFINLVRALTLFPIKLVAILVDGCATIFITILLVALPSLCVSANSFQCEVMERYGEDITDTVESCWGAIEQFQDEVDQQAQTAKDTKDLFRDWSFCFADISSQGIDFTPKDITITDGEFLVQPTIVYTGDLSAISQSCCDAGLCE